MPVVQHIVCTIIGPSPNHPTLQCQIPCTFYAHHSPSLALHVQTKTTLRGQQQPARSMLLLKFSARMMLQSNMVPKTHSTLCCSIEHCSLLWWQKTSELLEQEVRVR